MRFVLILIAAFIHFQAYWYSTAATYSFLYIISAGDCIFFSWTFFSVHQYAVIPLHEPYWSMVLLHSKDAGEISNFLVSSVFALFFSLLKINAEKRISSPSSFSIPLFASFSSKINLSVKLKLRILFVKYCTVFDGLHIFS